MDKALQQHRAAIDAIDDELLKLVNARAQHAQAIGALKGGGLVYRPEREAQVLRRIRENNPGPLSGESVTRLFREIMSACLALEKPLKVAYLGPEGTFSQAAAIKHFGHAANTEPCASIDEVFRNVEAGTADYGVVPVENSTGGAVGTTLDLLLEAPLKVCGEVDLRIHQFLLRKPGAKARAVKVYSHAQSLTQCHEWLNQHLPDAERIPVVSNTKAAKLASEDENAAAIAGEAAAEVYGLEKVARNIEDKPNNTTRFLVIAQHDAAPSGRDKTSLVLSSKNQPGAVYELLAPFARFGVSMSKLESRPSRTGLWEYMFFVDVEGHQQDEKVAQALAELRDRAAFLKVLGSYPAAVL
ncbi:MAG: prephenate dehydratase [Sulfuricella sp.]|jgi:chorismate mutase/prephenate dehydratase|nr:prephenate dehydratase [Sulfuricella sp.]